MAISIPDHLPLVHLVRQASDSRTACGLMIRGHIRLTLKAAEVTCRLCQIQMEADDEQRARND